MLVVVRKEEDLALCSVKVAARAGESFMVFDADDIYSWLSLQNIVCEALPASEFAS